MTYDGLVLAAVIAEMRSTITGARIQKIRQHNDTDLTLEVRGPGHTFLLFFSVDAKFARVYLTSSMASVPQQPPNFCMLLRKHLEGAFIARIEQIGFDRVARIVTQAPGQPEHTLVLEIMGKHSNLILVDSEEKILGAVKHVGASISRYRQVLPGRQYAPPPGESKLDLRDLDAADIDRLWRPEASDAAGFRTWLMSTFAGFGPFLADEVSARVVQDGAASPERAREELLSLAAMARGEAFSPVYITTERGDSLMVYPMESAQFTPDRQHARQSMNESLDALFRTLVTRTELEDERTQLLTAIRRAQASRKQAIKSIDRTLAESERADGYRQVGELLLASLHAVEKGAKSVTLVNYFDPEMAEIAVELDEKLTAQQNAERYFKRYQKARDAVATAQSRREHVTQELDSLESARIEAESTKSVDALKTLRKALTDRDLLRQEVSQEKHAEEFGGERIRRFYTPEGWEILYGETSHANDYLTQRVARPSDVWLHARSITGAHVVIRTAGHSGAVPKPVLTQAALIAARNSDAKHSSLVPVDHTQRKYVRKPRGSAPGFVTYRNEKTIDISPRE